MRWILLFISSFVLLPNPYAQQIDPAATNIDGPVPRAVIPGDNAGSAPSDAIILFDGSSLDEWERVGGGDPEWLTNDDAITVVPGSSSIRTKRKFSDIQLHIEWRSPPSEAHSENLKTDRAAGILERNSNFNIYQIMANSGIFLQERYEIQVLEMYGLKTYVNGQAGSVYKQHIPLVSASRPPGEWQIYDVVFQAPRFNASGTVAIPARLTLLHNGVLIQNNVSIWGPTGFIGLPSYKPHGSAPIMLQSHVGVSQISYRNIWVREL
jgi:hypothetical protein